MRCCRSAWPELPRPRTDPPAAEAGEFSGRSARSSERFSAPTYRAAGCRPVRLSREASRARLPTRWSAGWLPISANRWAARLAVRSAARWYAARSAGCCDGRVIGVFAPVYCDGISPLIFRKVACAEISVVASAARYSFSGLLCRADRRRSRSGNLGERKDKGLSALVLGRAAGPAGQGSLSQRSLCLFRIHLSAAARGPARDTQLFRQDTSLSMPVGSQRGRMVDDGAILERDDGLGANTRPLAGGAAGLRYGNLCFRHVRSRAAQSHSAGDDVAWVLAAAARAPVDVGKHVCAGCRHQGFSGGGVSLSALAQAMGVSRRHDCLPRNLSVRGSGSGAWFSAQRFRAEDMVSGNGWIQLGAGLRAARRAELVLGQPVHYRGDAPADAPDQLQPG